MSIASRIAKQASVAAPPHIIVKAGAGTGKTTTCIGGMHYLKGIDNGFTPSDEQRAIWESLAEGETPSTVCFLAYNASIARELKSRVPEGTEARTFHSLGLAAVRNSFTIKSSIQFKSNKPKFRTDDHIAEILKEDRRETMKRDPLLYKAVKALVSHCKQSLLAGTPEELSQVCRDHDIDCGDNRETHFGLVPQLLERATDVEADGFIDFDDMVWLPIKLGLRLTKFDLLFIDEAQDLNRTQQNLAYRSGKRLVFVGDPNQAIYGFAGADSKSINRLHDKLESSEQGCITLPLTVSRRCAKAIVREANRYVEDFYALDGAPEGMVDEMKVQEYRRDVRDGDMILSRVNAPLVSECFRFIALGRKANIQGRKIGQGLKTLITSQKSDDLGVVINRIEDWFSRETDKESRKKRPNENTLIALSDKKKCIDYFLSAATSVQDALDSINNVFTDKSTSGILLSSIHKAKGLEAKRVFFLKTENAPCPHPMAKQAWAKAQELNLCYVAVTRAIDHLTYITGDPKNEE